MKEFLISCAAKTLSIELWTEITFLVFIILAQLSSSALFSAFINSKPPGRKTALGIVENISTTVPFFVYQLFACSPFERDHNSHKQHHQFNSLHHLAGEDNSGRGTSIPSGHPRTLLATVTKPAKTDLPPSWLTSSVKGCLRLLLCPEVGQQNH